MISQKTQKKYNTHLTGQALELLLAQLGSDAGRALALETLLERGMIIETPYTPDEARAVRKASYICIGSC